MIPKSSRFKCCHCGWLKRKPGKCVACRKVADFDGGEGSNPSRSAKPKKTAQACAEALGWAGGVNGASHHSNFPCLVLAEPCGPVQRPQSGEARESIRLGIKPDSRGGESNAASAL